MKFVDMSRKMHWNISPLAQSAFQWKTHQQLYAQTLGVCTLFTPLAQSAYPCKFDQQSYAQSSAKCACKIDQQSYAQR